MSKSSAARGRTYAWCVLPVAVIAIAILGLAVLILSSTKSKAAKAPANPGKTAQRLAQPSSLPAQAATPAQRQSIHAALAALPLAFEKNEGQADGRVQYLARGSGYRLYLTSSDAVLSFSSSAAGRLSKPKLMMEQRLLGYSRKNKGVIRRQSAGRTAVPASVASLQMHVVNGDPSARLVAADLLPGKVNYYIGSDLKKWHPGVREFGRVSYENIYPGVDLAYHGRDGQLEFDFVVAANANPSPIVLGFAGVRRMTTDGSGNLLMTMPEGKLTLHKPVAYQERSGSRENVEARFVLRAHNQVGFELGNYDRSRQLVIDPTLSYATYIGGNGDDEAYGIAVDTAGNFYVTGESDSASGFPGENPSAGGYDAFVVQITSSGTLGYTTFVGGSGDDLGAAIAVNPSTGAAYVAGITTSTDFPGTSGFAQPTSGSPSGSFCTGGNGSAPCSDGFVFELSPAGSAVYATYLGGSNDDGAFGVALDASGNAYVTGYTFSTDFRLKNALYTTINNGVTSSPIFEDAFVAEVNNAGTELMYSTYLGGQNNDFGSGIAVDGSGNAYVIGTTSSPDFPTSSGAFQSKCGTDGTCNAGQGLIFSDAFVSKLSASGAALSYSTYLGGSSDDAGLAVAVDGYGEIYVTGQTTYDNTSASSDDFPVVAGGYQGSFQGSSAGSNAFTSKINPAAGGSYDLLFSSFLGGNTADVGLGAAVDLADNFYVTGSTLSGNFPSSSGFQTTLNGNSDAFISKVSASGTKLVYSSYLGGTGDENYDSTTSSFLGGEVALDATGEVDLAGSTTSTTELTAGTPFQATYGSGAFDGFAANVSTTVSPDFTIYATNPAGVAPGASGTSTVTLTAAYGYSSAVTLSCSVAGTGSDLPACSTSSFSSGSVTPTSTGATSTLTITTTGATSAMVRPSRFLYAMWLPLGGMALLGLSFQPSKKGSKKWLGFLLLGIVLSGLLLMPACGGGSSSGGGGGGGGGNSGTPAGTYGVTITGTDANNLTHSITVPLVVN